MTTPAIDRPVAPASSVIISQLPKQAPATLRLGEFVPPVAGSAEAAVWDLVQRAQRGESAAPAQTTAKTNTRLSGSAKRDAIGSLKLDQ